MIHVDMVTYTIYRLRLRLRYVCRSTKYIGSLQPKCTNRQHIKHCMAELQGSSTAKRREVTPFRSTSVIRLRHEGDSSSPSTAITPIAMRGCSCACSKSAAATSLAKRAPSRNAFNAICFAFLRCSLRF
jgi:hypothetical protein